MWEEHPWASDEQFTTTRRNYAVTSLIILNILGFALSGILELAFAIPYLPYMQLDKSSAIDKLWIWQFLTYGFAYQVGSIEVLFMIIFLIMLYQFGKWVEHELGDVKLLVIYFACQILGGIGHIAYQYISDSKTPAYGNAIPGIMAIIMTASLIWPNRSVLFFLILPMRLMTSTLIILGVVVFYSVIYFKSGFAPIPPIAACLAAVIIHKLEPILEGSLFKLSDRMSKYQSTKENQMKRIVDKILDKINQYGMQSLSKKEIKILKKASKYIAERRE